MTPAHPVSLPDSLEARYALVRERLAAAAAKSGRRAEDIILVAVTKAADPDQVRALLELGHRDFGENKVQQLIQRAAMVDEYYNRLKVLPTSRGSRRGEGDPLFDSRPKVDLIPTPTQSSGVRWHMIGHLQRNKAKKCVEVVRLIHSVDSLRLAEELQTIALKRDEVVEVLIEVNCSGEATKQGCPVPAAIPLAEQIETMMNVRLRGLMTMAAPRTNPDASVGPAPSAGADETRACFARCRELFEEMLSFNFSERRFNILSMGMSGDFELAIQEGANIVRVGTAIFGEGRPHTPDGDDEDDAERTPHDDE